MRLMTPTTIELTYSLKPDALKPGIELQGRLAQIVKREAMGRFSRGEPLTFCISSGGISQHTSGEAQRHRAMALDQRAKGGLIAGEHAKSPRDDRGVITSQIL